MDALRFGPLDDPENGERNRRILEGVVGGISHYGNCFGVPTVGGETVFETCYDGNPLVNVFALGVFRHDEIFFGRATGDRQSGDLRRREDRPRRHQGRVDGVGGVRRGFEGQASQRAGGRSLHGEAAARSVPGGHAHGRDRRHSGYGRGGVDVLHV